MNSQRIQSVGLMALKILAYAASVLLIVYPLASLPGLIAAAAAVPLGVIAAHVAIRCRVRAGVVLATAGAVAGLGLFAQSILGTPLWLSKALSVPTVLTLIGVMTFGLLVFATVVALRYLANRYPTLVVLEGMAVVLVVVLSFVGHRESNIGQPREFADWAFGAGHDPRQVLRILGVVTAAGTILLLLNARRGKQAVGAIVVLAALMGGMYAASLRWLPDLERQVARHDDDDPSKGEDPKDPKKTEKPRRPGTPGREADHGDGQQDRESPSFSPQDWPNKPKPMAIVTLEDDYKPAQGNLYFRQNVYSQYNGRRLVRAVAQEIDADVPRDFPVEAAKVSLSPGYSDVKTTVPMTISLLRPHVRPFGLTNVSRFEARANRNPDTFIRSYFCESQALTKGIWDKKFLTAKGGDPKWSADVRASYLQGPLDPRFKALADEILSKIDSKKVPAPVQNSTVVRALTIRRWIEKNMVYSLNADHSHAEDPVSSFLFGDRRGYCVHVAHAMTYLLRSVGIPARTAVGYSADAARSGQGSGILLSCTDAHAWCEVYLEGLGWTVMDAALERSETPPPPPADVAAQSFYNNQNRPKFEPQELVKAEELAPARKERAVLLAALLAVVALFGLYSVKVWRTVAPKFAPAGQLYRVCYRAAVDRLAELGQVRQFGETREEFAERIAKWNPEFLALSQAHVRRAVTGLEPCQQAEWQRMLARTLDRIRGTMPRKSRVFGRLRPLSWLRTR